VTTAIVVGSEDRHLTALLAAHGLRARVVPEDTVLASYSRAEADALLVVDVRSARAIPAWMLPFRRQCPSAPILMVLPSLDPGIILEAMRSGANECLAEPLTEDELRAALRRLTNMRAVGAPGKVFAFVGAKGGVGATTTAVNVATALSALPANTVFMDLHLAHGDAAVYFGVEPRFSVVDALENMNRLDLAYFKGLVTKAKSGPDLLASSDRAFVGNAAVQHVRQLVEFASRQYRYTVLDVPRSDVAALEALDLATRIIVVANQELGTVRNASRMAEALRRRYGKDRVGVIITRYDPASQIGQDDVERVTGAAVAGVIPNDYRLALEALNTGRPVMVENHNRLAASFRQLAVRLTGNHETKDEPTEQSGLFNRLLGRRS